MCLYRLIYTILHLQNTPHEFTEIQQLIAIVFILLPPCLQFRLQLRLQFRLQFRKLIEDIYDFVLNRKRRDGNRKSLIIPALKLFIVVELRAEHK